MTKEGIVNKNCLSKVCCAYVRSAFSIDNDAKKLGLCASVLNQVSETEFGVKKKRISFIAIFIL